jgi:hypothetical protein
MFPCPEKKTKIKTAGAVLLAVLLAAVFAFGAALPASAGVAPDVSWYTDDQAATEFYIDDEADMFGLWYLMSDKISDYAPGADPLDFMGCTITLRSNLDLASVSRDWIPIGKYDPYTYLTSTVAAGGPRVSSASGYNGAKFASFHGTFDGGGHTVRYSGEETDGWQYGNFGFFLSSAIMEQSAT